MMGIFKKSQKLPPLPGCVGPAAVGLTCIFHGSPAVLQGARSKRRLIQIGLPVVRYKKGCTLDSGRSFLSQDGAFFPSFLPCSFAHYGQLCRGRSGKKSLAHSLREALHGFPVQRARRARRETPASPHQTCPHEICRLKPGQGSNVCCGFHGIQKLAPGLYRSVSRGTPVTGRFLDVPG